MQRVLSVKVDLGWLNQSQVVPELFEDIVTLEIGEVTKTLLQSSWGWHVIRLDDHHPVSIKPQAYERLRWHKVEARVSPLKALATIETY